MAKNDNTVVRLCLVCAYGRSPIFIGWSSDNKVLASTLCSDDVERDFLAAKQSGANFPRLSTDNITCFEYSSLSNAIDYPGNKEDVISIIAKDGNGNSTTINLGESTILNALEWAMSEENIWNSILEAGVVDDGTGVTSALKMYTLIFQDNRVNKGVVSALLFRPLTKGQSNEGTFFRFVKSIVKQLLIIDESQASSQRKGYIQLAAQISKSSKKGGLADLIFDTRDKKTAEAVTKARVGSLKLLQTLGIAEVSQETIDSISDPLPDYNIDKLSDEDLLKLISSMKELSPYRNRS